MKGIRQSHRKILMAIILVFTAIVLIYLTIVYFPPRYEYGADDNLQKILEDTKKTAENFQNQYDQFSDVAGSIKNNFQKSGQKDLVSQNDTLLFQEGILDIVNKKNIEKLDSVILDMKSNVPEGWEMKITTLEKGVHDSLIAQVLFKGKKECGECKDATTCNTPDIFFPKKQLAFYLASLKVQVQKALEEYNAIIYEGMCRQAEAYETEKFLIVDSCSNARSCEDKKELEDSLKKYFETHKEQILN